MSFANHRRKYVRVEHAVSLSLKLRLRLRLRLKPKAKGNKANLMIKVLRMILTKKGRNLNEKTREI